MRPRRLLQASSGRLYRVSSAQPPPHLCSMHARSLHMQPASLTCKIDAEPLPLYRKGGYHPVHLGDVMHEGRYRIIHKLGWGGWSTVWAARDLRTERYVALKIATADSEKEARETSILKILNDGAPRSPHLVQMLDHFRCEGPNGWHDCVVLEFLGPSVASLVRDRCAGDRLPGKLAKRFARDAFDGIAALHRQGVAHGDVHVGNLALSLPNLDSLEESAFMLKMGKPEIGKVYCKDDSEPGVHVPDYIVRPSTFPIRISEYSGSIKWVDFGESFCDNAPPSTLHTPLPVRAPEVIFGDCLTTTVDLWSAACMLYELVVGQPPFDTLMQTKPMLVAEMIGMANDALPDRWKSQWETMGSAQAEDDLNGVSLGTWLDESYFDGERPVDLTKDDIAQLREIIRKLLCFEPTSRIPASTIAEDPWFTT